MSLRRIVVVQDPDAAVLRATARPVRRFDRDLRRLVQDMLETMREAPGVGLAAPQVAVDLRVIVAELPIDGDEAGGEGEVGSGDEGLALRTHAIVNPEIVWRSESIEEDQEACLSIPGLFGDVPRHTAIRLTGQDSSGRPLTLEASGFEARVLQHEIDHLDGLLFTDRVTGLDKLYTLRQAADGAYERVPYAMPA